MASIRPWDELILSHANLIHYWPLDGTLTDQKGSNDLTGTNSWTDGHNGNVAALLDGISQQLQSTSNIDLTGTNKVTLEMMICWIVYDTTNINIQAEFGNNYPTIPGFSLNTQGTVANDPLATSCRTNAAAGNNGLHNFPNNGIVVKQWRHLAMVCDVTLASDETLLYIQGLNRTRDSQSALGNNSDNFQNAKLYLGSRAGTSLYSNIIISNVAFFNTALSATVIKNHFEAMLGAYSINKNNLGIGMRDSGSIYI